MEQYIRVSETLRCPICQHEDWCMIHQTGRWCVCNREPSEVYLKLYNGWRHDLQDYQLDPHFLKKAKKVRPVPVNWNTIYDAYVKNVDMPQLQALAISLGVNLGSLIQLGIGWDGEAWTFPVQDADLEIVGIMRRWNSGHKKFVRGSHSGLYVPQFFRPDLPPVVICEGLSDTAAALDMKLNAIGRMNCQTGEDELKALIQVEDIIIVADNDPAGIRGAADLQREIGGLVVKTEQKDLRDQKCYLGARRCLKWLHEQREKAESQSRQANVRIGATEECEQTGNV